MSWGSTGWGSTADRRDRPRKYKRLEPLTFAEVIEEINRGNYMFVHHKPQHPRVVASFQLGMVQHWCASGYIRRAGITDEWLAMEARKKETQE